EYGGERVVQGLLIAGSDAYIKILSDGGKFLFAGRGKVPVREGFFRVAAGVGSAIAAQHLRRVVGGVEADAEQVSLRVDGGVGGERLVDVGEVVTHAHAEVRQRAARVDERDEKCLAFELGKVNGTSALVEQREVGHGVSRRRDVVLDRRLVVGARLRGDDDVVEYDVVETGFILVSENGGRDAVASVKFTDDAGVFELVRHRHRVHESGDSFAVEHDAGGVGADDGAAKGEGLVGG